MKRLARLNALRQAAWWHMMAAQPGTEARRIREARQRRIVAAYWAEAERVEAARSRRLAPYHKRSGRAA